MEPVNANVGAVTPQKSHTVAKAAAITGGVLAVGSLIYAAKKGNVGDAFKRVVDEVGKEGAEAGKKHFEKGFIRKAFKNLGAGYVELGKNIKKAPGRVLNFLKKHNPFRDKSAEVAGDAGKAAGEAGKAAGEAAK